MSDTLLTTPMLHSPCFTGTMTLLVTRLTRALMAGMYCKMQLLVSCLLHDFLLLVAIHGIIISEGLVCSALVGIRIDGTTVHAQKM